MDEMTYALVSGGMTLSVVFFALGYYFRKTSTPRHRAFMTAGVAANLISAVILVVSIHAFHGSDMRAAGFVPIVPPAAVLAHRLIAVVATVVMFAMVWTGVKGKRDLHIKLHRIFIPLYLVVYVSGMVIFTG